MSDRRIANGGFDTFWYDPAKAGLEILAVSDADLSYEFDIIVLLRDVETGSVFMAADTGCSCPSPFEDYNTLSDLTEVRTVEDVRRFWDDSVGEYSRQYHPFHKRQEFLRAAEAAL